MRRLVLAICFVSLLAGCGTFVADSQTPSDERAVAAVEEANSTVAAVEAYRFEMEMHVTASDGEQSRTVRVDGEGAVNVSAKGMQATTRMQDQTVKSYVDGHKAYQGCQDPWGGYAVENVSRSEPWVTTTPLHRQLLLFERSNVYWRGNETLDGNRTVLVTASPSAETIDSLMDRRQAGDMDLNRGSLENATARLWLDPNTNRPIQSELRIKISQRGATATATITVQYSEYGEPIAISIPPEVYDDTYELGCPGAS
jgi:outer membrane lipoprotein-sorting protein